ncbi:MAG TPA: hypothetical protein VMI31_08765 [Fimbriimonadaceae bacterium]|nr:hypothetical protein [Fimbriimonadaceae bacterium]
MLAYSHNDSSRLRPLFEALEFGFDCIEADVYAVERELLIGHDREVLSPERTLASHYLRPLAESNDRPMWLVIDAKEDGPAVYEAFKRALDRFPSLRESSIRFLLSGERPADLIARDGGEWAGIDGRWVDLDNAYPADLMPWVSADWTSCFAWPGEGSFPDEERTRLESMVGLIHGQGRKLRFWGDPDTPAAWQVLWESGVDIIGTDHLGELQAWMPSRRACQSEG